MDKCSCVVRARQRHSRTHKEYVRRVQAPSIGAIGWLRSCRINFQEGSSVLYSDNVLDIRSETLRLGVSHYMPHNQLSNVTAVEWHIDPLLTIVGKLDYRNGIDGPGRLLALERLIGAMFAGMPNLRVLYFGLDDLCVGKMKDPYHSYDASSAICSTCSLYWIV